jgi:hypothetical protein
MPAAADISAVRVDKEEREIMFAPYRTQAHALSTLALLRECAALLALLRDASNRIQTAAVAA